MPGISIERQGFTSCAGLADKLIQDLLASGFVVKHPALYTPGVTTPNVTMEAGPGVDPLAATQPWRLRIETSPSDLRLYVATPLQLPDDGTVAMESSTMAAGAVTSGTGSANSFFLSYGSSGGWLPSGATANAYPMSYHLSVSRHGVVFYAWLNASDKTGGKFSWMCVQRPVDNQTGAPFVTGKAPVFCVFATANQVRRFVVREVDVLRPQVTSSATTHDEDSRAIINDKNQVSISEDNKYILTFPNGLNTSRHAYTHELDLIAYTSADVISAWSEVPLTVYGEATPRRYKAMQASGPYNTGMRILMMVAGPGIGAPAP